MHNFYYNLRLCLLWSNHISNGFYTENNKYDNKNYLKTEFSNGQKTSRKISINLNNDNWQENEEKKLENDNNI